MSMACFAHAPNPQAQSRLVRLPAEIKHQIFNHCLTSDHVISDPVIHKRHPTAPTQSFNAAVLQTCRRLYSEIDRRPLFSQNTFRFTSAENAQSFLKALDHDYRQSVHDIEIHVHRIDANLARHLLRYLAWGTGPWASSTSCSLHTDAPNLKTLRLNFESWPRISMFRTELWILLRQLMATVRGLERIVVVGASKGQAMARQDPWSPAHFIGATDVDCNDLIPRMWKCVDTPDDHKVIRWRRSHGKISLEVVSKSHLARHMESTWRHSTASRSGDGCWPTHGTCSWSEYENPTRGAMHVSWKD
ncbi:hypothetical protein ACEQ8H_007874 [Pleosporales sp. CAS-2024a]